jgi:hypothetical protein
MQAAPSASVAISKLRRTLPFQTRSTWKKAVPSFISVIVPRNTTSDAFFDCFTET